TLATSPNRSRLLPTSVTLLRGRTLAIARFGWGEVGPHQRAGRGRQRFSPLPTLPRLRGRAREGGTPPRTAFGDPTPPLQGRVAGGRAGRMRRFKRAVPTGRIDANRANFHVMGARVPDDLGRRIKAHRLGVKQRGAEDIRVPALHP